MNCYIHIKSRTHMSFKVTLKMWYNCFENDVRLQFFLSSTCLWSYLCSFQKKRKKNLDFSKVQKIRYLNIFFSVFAINIKVIWVLWCWGGVLFCCAVREFGVMVRSWSFDGILVFSSWFTSPWNPISICFPKGLQMNIDFQLNSHDDCLIWL